jgi:hypothetical protein
VNRVITLVGVVLVVLGFLVSFVPLFDGPSQVLTPNQSVAAYNATAGVSLTSDWTIGMTWTSNLRVSLLVAICHSINASASSLSRVCHNPSLTVLNGTSGSETFYVPVGGVFLVGIVSNLSPGLRVDIQLKPTLTLIGAILILGGIGVTVVGLLPRRKAPRPPPAALPAVKPAEPPPSRSP